MCFTFNLITFLSHSGIPYVYSTVKYTHFKTAHSFYMPHKYSIWYETSREFSFFFRFRLPHPKIVRACGLALARFETNSVNTNNCIVKLLHRIAFDCKMYVMVFQVSIFRSFQKIFAMKELPQNKVNLTCN